MPGLFPHGATLKKKEGTQISVESQPFRLTRLISEKFIDTFQERLAVFEGQRLLDEEAVILKLRFQCVHLFSGLSILCLLLKLPQDGSILN
jgi:hypothetical protein